MILSEWLALAVERLEEAGIESARLEAQILATHVLGKDRAWILAHVEMKAPEKNLEAVLSRRLTREPLAYILGYREFYGRRFVVDRRVLIPRQETETLVEAALDCLSKAPLLSVLDLGTGSGCIGITLALERPEVQVTGSDASEDALKVAKLNAKRLKASVQFLRSNGFEEVEDSFSLIVTNPPYVRCGEALQPEVADWEPPEALFAGNFGLEFFEVLAQKAHSHLNHQGLLLTEVGDGQADAASDVFQTHGWLEVKRKRDLVGHERVLILARS